MEEERPMIVDRDGGRSPGEIRGEKAVGRVETPLRRLGLAIFKEADGAWGASFTQAIFMTETLARGLVTLVSKWMEQKCFRPLRSCATTRDGTDEPPSKLLARVLRH